MNTLCVVLDILPDMFKGFYKYKKARHICVWHTLMIILNSILTYERFFADFFFLAQFTICLLDE